MWDKETPLQLLSTMPNVLEEKHLEKLQMLLEADKYKNQLLSGLDLCGTYAPFCDGCNKENKYPCAIAYVNYLKEQGVDIQIAEDLNNVESESAPEPENTAEVSENSTEEENITAGEPEGTAEEENAPSEVEEVVEEVKAEEEPNNTEEQPKKTKIRIAVARKKIL